MKTLALAVLACIVFAAMSSVVADDGAVAVVNTPVDPEIKFHLRPGVPADASVGMDGIVCKFEWTVDGGTGEEWNMAIQKVNDQYVCSMGRATSYLYFKKFLVSLTKAEVVSVNAESNGAAIEPHTANKKNNRLRNRKDWEGNMSTLSVTMKKVENAEL